VEVSDACSPQDHGETHDRQEEDDRQEDDQEGQEVRPRSDRPPVLPAHREEMAGGAFADVREGAPEDAGLAWGTAVRHTVACPPRRGESLSFLKEGQAYASTCLFSRTEIP